MKTRIVKAEIDINELKKEAVHPGLLEVMLLLMEVRDKANRLTEDENVICFSSIHSTLNSVGEHANSLSCDVGNAIGVLFAERVDEYLMKEEKMMTQS